MLLLDDGEGHVISANVRLRDRLAARLQADRIDLELAQGAPPDATVLSALRAETLTATCTRHRLAQGLRRAVSEAMTRTNDSGLDVTVNRPAVRDTADLLAELSRRLVADGPVPVQGAAYVKVLLTEGGSPIYKRGAASTLPMHVQRALDALAWP